MNFGETLAGSDGMDYDVQMTPLDVVDSTRSFLQS